ncbi:hypothetical protein J2858_003277 [Neorhizobium galegae]|uniref:hypothetical protein n=1 Tax=Rhizobium/Agrobacterium group TaxID=227290 RepID=UPI001AE36D6C|nr:hypothetical protein [Neorhizobium galegae]MBP2550341.1 hypothetical protein [Neorhizobium galegae]
MEITSFNWSGSLLQQEQGFNTRHEKPQFIPSPEAQRVFDRIDVSAGAIDFSAISPRLLRELALQRYISGAIQQDVYIALAQELPVQAVDTSGRVLDLSGVTDDTEFDFQDYFRQQHDLAQSLGDEDKALTFASVLDFIEA